MEAIQFCNYTKEDFTWKYDGIPYTFKAGTTMFLEDFKASHFAKHLIDRELNKANVDTGLQFKRDELMSKILISSEAITPLEALQKNATIKETTKEVVEFEGLGDTPKGGLSK